MIELLRIKRNQDELRKVHEFYRSRFLVLLQNLESVGHRPRLQDTFRSNADQLKKFNAGLSQLRGGGPHTYEINGRPYSLATHFLDDDFPTSPTTAWITTLAIEAHKVGLQTGCAWAQRGDSVLAPGKPHRVALDAAIAAGDYLQTKRLLLVATGFDPLHVEVPDWHEIMTKGQQ